MRSAPPFVRKGLLGALRSVPRGTLHMALRRGPGIGLVSFVCAAALGGFAWPAAGAVIRVPADQPDIQTGLDVASAGDTVLVAAGLYLEHDLDMKSGVRLCSETGNPADVTIDAAGLGRVAAFYLDEGSSIEGCTLTGGVVGANDIFSGRGGGIGIRDCSPVVRRCLITGNEAANGGGGISVLRGEPEIEECVLAGNRGVDGGAIHCNHAAPRIRRCVLHGNHAMVWGGAVCAENWSSPVLTGCTISGNDAWSGGGLWCVAQCHPRLENCLVAFSARGEGIFVYDNPSVPSEVTLTCCDVYGNADGEYGGHMEDPTGQDGNISSDPFFCDAAGGDFSLYAHSPCLPDHNECGILIGALGAGCVSTGASDPTIDGGGAGNATGTMITVPNPFTGETTVAFRIDAPVPVEISIFDCAGRRVRTLLRETSIAAGLHRVRWDGRGDSGHMLPGGVYLCRMTTGDTVTVTRMVRQS